MESKYIMNFKKLLESDVKNLKDAYMEIALTLPAGFKNKSLPQQMSTHMNYVKVAQNYSNSPTETNKVSLEKAIEEIQNLLTNN